MIARRRRLLGIALAVAALAALVAGAAAGRRGGPVDVRGAHVERLTIDSAAVGRKLRVRIVYPAGVAAGDGSERPLLVFLHGRGTSIDGYLGGPFFAALSRLGDRAPVVAFPSGGDHSYWHDRRDGAWGRYVIKEVIPRVQAHTGVDSARTALGGISMGGFGAFDLARLHRKAFCAVGGHSPALWTSADQTAPGAFDDAADFDRHDVIRAARRFAGQRVWIDAGDADPFQPGDRAFVAALRARGQHPSVHTAWSGGHDGDYWDAHWRDYLRFYGRALADCGS